MTWFNIIKMNEATKFAREWLLQWKDDTILRRELEGFTMFHEHFGTPSLEEFKTTSRQHFEAALTPKFMKMLYEGDETLLKQLEKKVARDLGDLSKRAGKGGESNFKGILNNLTKNDYVVEQTQAVVDVYKEMSSSQYKRAATNYKKRKR